MKILSLNGGGSLGYITISILEHLEQNIDKQCYELFDIISGVSTGSIIGYALSCGIPASVIKENYKKFIPEIFGNKRGFIRSFFGSLYKSENLENVIKDYFGDRKINETKTKFMTYACRLNDPATRPEFWKSWKESGDIEAYKAICASCSAPLYFDPYNIDGSYFTDGGIVSNSCNIASIVEARKLGITTDEIKMVNFGFLTYNNFDKKDLLGLIRVASNVTGMSVGGTEYMEEHQTKTMLPPGQFLGCFPECYGLAMDTIDFSRMDNIVSEFIFANASLLNNFLTVTTQVHRAIETGSSPSISSTNQVGVF